MRFTPVSASARCGYLNRYADFRTALRFLSPMSGLGWHKVLRQGTDLPRFFTRVARAYPSFQRRNLMLPFVILVVLLVGVSTILWSSIGLIRVIASWTTPRRDRDVLPQHPDTSDVAVIIAAHNEEMVIGGTLRSLEKLIPASNIV
jgi:hypothetical protein